MAITDTSPVMTGSSETTASAAPQGLVAIVGSGDHKTIGRLYIGFSMAFGAAALGALAWSFVEAASDPASQTQRALMNVALGRLGLVFLLVMPLFIGLATAIVPLQVGARTIAFPRASAAAFWTWLVSAVLLVVSNLSSVGGGIGGDDANGIGLTYIALGGLVLSLLLATVCVVTTVITLRPTGMWLDRVPFFSWSMVVAGGLWILTLPAFLMNLVLVFVDQKYGAPALFAVQEGQWAQLAWVTSPPQVFVFAIPALGVIADVASTLAGARQPQRGFVLAAIGVFGALGFGAYVQPAFNPDAYHQFPFVAQAALILLPLLGIVAGIAGVSRRGKPTFRSPAALSTVGLLLVLLGAIAAVPIGLGRLGLQSTSEAVLDVAPGLQLATGGSPIYTWGVSSLVLIGAFAVGIAGIVFWSSKLTGKQLPEGLGLLLALGVIGAGLLLAGPFLALGFANKADGLADSTKTFLFVAAAGAAIALGVALLTAVLLVGNRAAVLAGGETVDPDPWGTGQTFEWLAESPPAPGNFGELAVVVSPEPLLDLAEGGDR